MDLSNTPGDYDAVQRQARAGGSDILSFTQAQSDKSPLRLSELSLQSSTIMKQPVETPDLLFHPHIDEGNEGSKPGIEITEASQDSLSSSPGPSAESPEVVVDLIGDQSRIKEVPAVAGSKTESKSAGESLIRFKAEANKDAGPNDDDEIKTQVTISPTGSFVFLADEDADPEAFGKPTDWMFVDRHNTNSVYPSYTVRDPETGKESREETLIEMRNGGTAFDEARPRIGLAQRTYSGIRGVGSGAWGAGKGSAAAVAYGVASVGRTVGTGIGLVRRASGFLGGKPSAKTSKGKEEIRKTIEGDESSRASIEGSEEATSSRRSSIQEPLPNVEVLDSLAGSIADALGTHLFAEDTEEVSMKNRRLFPSLSPEEELTMRRLKGLPQAEINRMYHEETRARFVQRMKFDCEVLEGLAKDRGNELAKRLEENNWNMDPPTAEDEDQMDFSKNFEGEEEDDNRSWIE